MNKHETDMLCFVPNVPYTVLDTRRIRIGYVSYTANVVKMVANSISRITRDIFERTIGPFTCGIRIGYVSRHECTIELGDPVPTNHVQRYRSELIKSLQSAIKLIVEKTKTIFSMSWSQTTSPNIHAESPPNECGCMRRSIFTQVLLNNFDPFCHIWEPESLGDSCIHISIKSLY